MGHLFILDFDGTIADTFTPSPNDIGVESSYFLAVADVLGEEGSKIYNEGGGLRNRAPQEVVYEILQNATSTQRKNLLDCARSFLLAHGDELHDLVPEGKGLSLEWREDDPVSIVSELVVRCKLGYSYGEIGGKWPLPTEGFIDFRRSLTQLNNDGVAVDLAIVSSGHDLFIDRVFKTWGLEAPSILITDDTLRGKKYPKEVERRVKPSAFPLALAHFEWLKERGLWVRAMEGLSDLARRTRPNIAFIGDDPHKDGDMAERARITFGLFKKGDAFQPDLAPSRFKFGDWSEFGKMLQSRKGLLEQGKEFNEILLGHPRRSPERV
ncbi:hypothetical protein A3G67_00820 [Candidatus Roizmanbacteria bacterium RIFCSPLOWO2_12_FULL_40_12]|uniref:Haloacid dehalogenase-like hydrolase n=1 Tax=Candidatus Roizmanbacteria bacterium RIFCSPLOWO2_01_FULL_40_42 TaxID=1802066 RepID=A0A1F7J6T1_9BACT|nr:MAG: hypothetical protein A2779_02345 [Candidatus Roizmanbacteria bacterium RIFCSPHIGHO2_01_FULL_40_98]OGK27191.1 MAG: hypothetical protein A3C31_02980 [Candidatus Roizmanbacteria bacterium RIFCSPHIGHO2_02_FULL_40_53]OGK30064.1 MAG: hypothetical protein A2W49_04015 [Candidatus Roizmanbacteria bacterium RIFCSPHIGHO2_12_41_18]OGK36064.1 MAG: hypothetical protein A3E69_02925 [Candidatus Roizmanbacteria bacterium RIFCSPHIGHO2_12_FULL_40_130]OGK51303.1 MAG: hypothetical protein A3B50_02560 [Candi